MARPGFSSLPMVMCYFSIGCCGVTTAARGIPGGALASGETAAVGALREANEEAHIDTSTVDVLAEIVDDHGRWTYTTVIARASHQLAVRHGLESIAVQWVPLDDVATFNLHPGFAKTLPRVLARVATV